MQRQRELLAFRTPQHPSLGTNHWGGASPLLARNVPAESLETKYLRLTSIRTKDEIITPGDELMIWTSKIFPSPAQKAAPQCRGFFLRWIQRKRKSVLGDKKKRRWLPFGDPQKRWPQGREWDADHVCFIGMKGIESS
ncbi:hypothetical protein H6P81_017519 [Aristolochia fimbriata]|uniref:Uncharacterized protein n=1 Tax=Aristolochia fimbriata TaxID=158543 RepID=A0AAV7DYC0_ARIFI|nr:hypothetical protein H6P81_017519 [Aristolochia fimbriata]